MTRLQEIEEDLKYITPFDHDLLKLGFEMRGDSICYLLDELKKWKYRARSRGVLLDTLARDATK